MYYVFYLCGAVDNTKMLGRISCRCTVLLKQMIFTEQTQKSTKITYKQHAQKAFVKYCNTSFYINSTILQFKLRKSCVVLFCFFPSAAWHVSVFGIFRFVFSRIRTEYGDLLCKSLYSVQMRENKDQKNSLWIQTLFVQ